MLKEKDLEIRTKRAQAMVAMGLVKRDGERFLVGAKSFRGRQGQYEVRRDEASKVRCNCDEFTEAVKTDVNFRCEHILAVKLSLMPATPEVAGAAPLSLVADAAHSDASQTRVSVESELALAEKGGQEMMNPTLEVETGSNGAAMTTDFRDILRRLGEPIPEEFIRRREGWRGQNGEMRFVDYINWHTVADLLDEVAPDWSHSVRAIVQIGELVAVTASITIQGVTREGIGTGPAKSEMGIKKAEHDALKRAAVKFGIARELYKHADDGEELSTDLPAAQNLARDPVAKTLADLVTPKQLVAIRAIAQALGLDADDECLTLYNCKPEELSRKAASLLIDYLKSRQQSEPELRRQAG
jgi:hypothetical protein